MEQLNRFIGTFIDNLQWVLPQGNGG